MSSEFIYNILISKPHNSHYLLRYLKYLEVFKDQEYIKGVHENHHICPKSNDLFPEYKSFRKNPWNKISLTKRQHFIAHLILSKVYPKTKQTVAFWAFCNIQSPNDSRSRNFKVNSRFYETAKENISKFFSDLNKGRKNQKLSEKNLGFVACFDLEGNFLSVSKEEFDLRKNVDFIAVSKNVNRDYMKTKEYKLTMSKANKNRIHIINQNTGIKKFVNPEELDHYINNGYIVKFVPYDRKTNLKICPYCNKQADSANFARWHGKNCKLK